jgi:hypothetical protein
MKRRISQELIDFSDKYVRGQPRYPQQYAMMTGKQGEFALNMVRS